MEFPSALHPWCLASFLGEGNGISLYSYGWLHFISQCFNSRQIAVVRVPCVMGRMFVNGHEWRSHDTALSNAGGKQTLGGRRHHVGHDTHAASALSENSHLEEEKRKRGSPIDSKLIFSKKCSFFVLLNHEGSNREVYWEFQPSCDIVRRWCQGLFRPQDPCSPAGYTAQLLTLHQPVV